MTSAILLAMINLLEPTHVVAEGAGFTNDLVRSDGIWCANGVTVAIGGNGDVRVRSPKAGLNVLRLEWEEALPPSAKVYRDAWERTGGNSGWYMLAESPALPWYTLIDDGKRTDGYGVAVQPNAFACWLAQQDRLTLFLDLRAGSQPVELGARELAACRLVQRAGKPGENAFAAARAFARMMCPVSRLPKEPVFGYNDWYCAYGKNTATNFLADAAYITECAKGLPVRPYVVMDDGWQPMNPWEIEKRTSKFDSGRGPWTESAVRFGMAMPAFTKAVSALGAKPGLWYRPLRAHDDTPAAMRLTNDDRYFDPTVPAVEALIRADLARFRSWGMKLVKIDYLVGDSMRAMERAMTVTPIVMELPWRDRSRTSAEVLLELYRAMREAAGDDMVIIGCNAFNHFAAGLFEVQRTGNDTSGRNWKQTKVHGVNTLAMRAHQDGIFFSVDADCAGLVSPEAVPWEKNSQWIDLLGRSGTATFVSWFRDLATDEVRKAIAAAYAHAAAAPATAEPLDWQMTFFPHRWRTADGSVCDYSWGEKGENGESGEKVKVRGEGEQRNVSTSTVQPSTSNLQPPTHSQVDTRDWRILAADRGKRRLFVMDGSPEGNGKILKVFDPLADARVAEEDRPTFGDIDEAKLADGGRMVIGCASSDAFFGFDYETEKLLFYGRLGKNMHSIDRLPDGKFAVACSTGSDRLVLVDLNGHPFEPAKQKYTPFASLKGAHGVVWDAKRNCLFALGYPYVVRYAYDAKTSTMTETGRWDFLTKDGDIYGHDLTAGGKGYYFTVHMSVRYFEPEDGAFYHHVVAKDAKSFHHSDDKGDLYSYATNLYWAERAVVWTDGERREVPIPEGSLVYKFRWLNP